MVSGFATEAMSFSAASDSLGDLGQGASLRIRQMEPSGQVGAQDFVFSDQILVLKEQLLVHHSCHMR
jgi:hypothetical protein